MPTIRVELTPEEKLELKGEPGKDSTVPGPVGPPGSKGDPGPASTVPGPPGPAGKDGATPDLSNYYTKPQVDEKINAIPTGGGGVVVGNSGLWLDTFAGADDDTKLDNAITASQAGSVKRPILLANRSHSFTKPRTLTSGTKLINPFGFGNQLRGANSIPCHVQYRGGGAWWTLAPGSVFDVEFKGIGFTSTLGAAQFMRSGSSVLWTSKISDVGFLNWAGVLGSATEKFQHTAIELSGWWNVNNVRGTSFHLGGSDSNLWNDGMLIDAGSKQMPADQYHIRFASTQKSNVGPIYMTAEDVKGIHISGNSGDGHLVMAGMRVEGRHATADELSNELIRIASGRVKIRDSWFGYTRGDYIAQTGGELILDGCDFGLGSGIAPTKAVLNQSGGTARVSNLTTNWGAKPFVSGPSIVKDSSVA